MTDWQGVYLHNIAEELKNIRKILEKQQSTEVCEGEWKLIKENVNFMVSFPKREEFIANTYQCSECGNKTNDRRGLPEICPWCGAKMKGAGDE